MSEIKRYGGHNIYELPNYGHYVTFADHEADKEAALAEKDQRITELVADNKQYEGELLLHQTFGRDPELVDAQLKEQISALTTENQVLRTELTTLKTEIAELRSQVQQIRESSHPQPSTERKEFR